ncbi:MAG: helix-turn-helix domain-containing protein [Ruminococcaceae bacterium]|nr:helix-turn-helix domain-containing protein [Oscillospiraceae bacterium]
MNEMIKKRRRELDITLEEVGDYVGVSKTTVQRWESGNISNMRRDRIKKLSEILQLDPDVLIGISSDKENGFSKIPVLGSVAAGLPVTAQEDILGYEEVPAQWTKNDVLFALKIKGDSMEPRIVQDDVVVVRQQNDVASGETAVVMVGDEATCKKVIKHSEGIALVANNPKYEPMYFTHAETEQLPVKILGKVIELRAKF